MTVGPVCSSASGTEWLRSWGSEKSVEELHSSELYGLALFGGVNEV